MLACILTFVMVFSLAPNFMAQVAEEEATFKVEFGHGAGVGEIYAFVGDVEIDSGDTVPAGTTVEFRATPSGQGFVIDRWVVNGVGQNHNNSTHRVENINSDLYVVVDFIEGFLVTFNSTGQGTLTAAAGGSPITSGTLVAKGSAVVFTAAPANN